MPETHQRTLLVVIDDSAECRSALRYACQRALHSGGRVALLKVIDGSELLHQWQGIEQAMLEEMREKAEEELQQLAQTVAQQVGVLPVLHVREGKPAQEIINLIKQEPEIDVLVLGGCSSADNPLVNYVLSQGLGELHVPITIVPDVMTIDDIDRIS
ncbi:MAG: universal stress protein [Pseudomonadota bacterium]